jgi:hypothetical protein
MRREGNGAVVKGAPRARKGGNHRANVPLTFVAGVRKKGVVLAEEAENLAGDAILLRGGSAVVIAEFRGGQ